MFRFFVIFQVPVCMPVPHDFWAGLAMDGVVYGVGRPSLTSIFYTPYFASIAVFNIPAYHTHVPRRGPKLKKNTHLFC